MSDLVPFTKQVLTMSIVKICCALGYTSISSVALHVLIDVVHRYMREMCVTVHNYMTLCGHVTPSFAHLMMAFREMNITIPELEDYVGNIAPITLDFKVPRYPVERPSRLNFLKPGSREVVTRPVHIHEHLPAMYPELSEEEYGSPDVSNTDNMFIPGLPNLINSGDQPLFKRPCEQEGTGVNKKIKLEDDDRKHPVRELSSVMMTTSGFLSPAREGKLPESRIPSFLLNIMSSLSQSNTASSSKEHRSKSSANKNLTKPEKRIKEEREPAEHVKEHDSKIKKLSNMKELSKLKAFKNSAVRSSEIPSYSSVIEAHKKIEKSKTSLPAVTVVQKEIKSSKMLKYEKSIEKFYKEPVEEKLTTEPDKQKLSIFKRITKPKEDRIKDDKIREERAREERAREERAREEKIREEREREERLREERDREERIREQKAREERIRQDKMREERNKNEIYKSVLEKNIYLSDKHSNYNINESIEAVVKRTKEPLFVESDKKETPQKKRKMSHKNVFHPKAYKRDNISHKMQKKHKKQKPNPQAEMEVEFPIEEAEDEEEFKLVENAAKEQMKPLPPPVGHGAVFPYFSQFGSNPGILPSSLSQNPLIPKLSSFPQLSKLNTSAPHPSMPNLPLPPPSLMHAVLTEKQKPSTSRAQLEYEPEPEPDPSEVLESLEKERRSKKQHKKLKKDKKEKDKKKKGKKDKFKCKEKLEKKKNKELLKKSKDEAKKEKVCEPEREVAKVEAVVPKLKLKLGSSSPQLSPSSCVSPKITIKTIYKHTTETSSRSSDLSVKQSKRDHAPELEKIPTLTEKPSKPKSHKIQRQTSPVPSTSRFVEPLTINIPAKKQEKAAKSKSKGKPNKIKKNVEIEEPKHAPYYYDGDGNQIWVCPTCGAQDDGSPMIGCDGCDAWYHWVCVGIKSAPESVKWFCSFCLRKLRIYAGTVPVNKEKSYMPVYYRGMISITE